jgi:hypothetical protein
MPRIVSKVVVHEVKQVRKHLHTFTVDEASDASTTESRIVTIVVRTREY